jgi:hypothetical protein
MSVQFRYGKWQAKARIRETRLDVYLGAYDTKHQAQEVIRDWYLRRYGSYHGGQSVLGHREAAPPG